MLNAVDTDQYWKHSPPLSSGYSSVSDFPTAPGCFSPLRAPAPLDAPQALALFQHSFSFSVTHKFELASDFYRPSRCSSKPWGTCLYACWTAPLLGLGEPKLPMSQTVLVTHAPPPPCSSQWMAPPPTYIRNRLRRHTWFFFPYHPLPPLPPTYLCLHYHFLSSGLCFLI